MISNKRRIFLIVISVSIGSILALLLWIARFGQVRPENMGNMIVNFAFSFALVFGISLFLIKNMIRKKKAKPP